MEEHGLENCYDPDCESCSPYGHCDTCGARCDFTGCPKERSHVIANPQTETSLKRENWRTETKYGPKGSNY